MKYHISRFRTLYLEAYPFGPILTSLVPTSPLKKLSCATVAQTRHKRTEPVLKESPLQSWRSLRVYPDSSRGVIDLVKFLSKYGVTVPIVIKLSLKFQNDLEGNYNDFFPFLKSFGFLNFRAPSN